MTRWLGARRCGAGLLVVGLAVAGTVACGDRLEALEGPGAVAPIPAEVQGAFDRSCNEGCHESSMRAGGLSLAEGDSVGIIEGASSQSDLPLVVLGDVEGSYLAIKMLPPEYLPDGVARSGARMPPSATVERQPDVALLLGWIAGAELSDEGSAP